ncbi:MAG: protein kinase [Cyanobacteria bacterium]|nr:protein kinase [Cyanobacteriota bacterium]
MTDEFWQSSSICQRYELLGELGRGGMGRVFKAYDKSLKRVVAIKVLSENVSEKDSMRFQQEAKLSGRLSHANIVSVLDFGISKGSQPYLVMEFLSGMSLHQTLSDEGPLELADALPFFIQICRAITHSHENGVLHRDLKPSNIMLAIDDSGETEAKVVDFGLARMKQTELTLTAPGVPVGSCLYMSPEQADGKRELDERSDIYSMGCLIFETLTGSPPFSGETSLETLAFHKDKNPPELKEVSGKPFSEGMEEIVRRCLCKNPDQRYQTFTALREDLERQEESFVTLPVMTMEASRENHIADSRGSIKSQRTRAGPVSVRAILVLAAAGCAALLFVALSKRAGEGASSSAMRFDLAPLPHVDSDKFTIREGTAGKVIECSQVVSSTFEILEDEDLKALANLTDVEEVNLKHSSITGEGFANLNLSTKRLDVRNCLITPRGLAAISRMKGLSILFLNSDTLTDEDLECLSQSDSLSCVSIAGSHFTSRAIQVLLKIPQLNNLQMHFMKVTPQMADYLQDEKVFLIHFGDCTFTPEALSRFSRGRTFKRIEFAGPTKVFGVEDIYVLTKIPSQQIALAGLTMDRRAVMQLMEPALRKRIKDIRDVYAPDCSRLDVAKLKEIYPHSQVHLKTPPLKNSEYCADEERKM